MSECAVMPIDPVLTSSAVTDRLGSDHISLGGGRRDAWVRS